MSALRLTLREVPGGGLDLTALTPSALAGKSRAQIGRLRLAHGGRSSRVQDLFEIEGEPGPELELRGMSAGCHKVGHAMASGRLQVSGTCGMELGREMSGGELRLKGDAGNGVGLGMCGGVITINGNAGDRVGGAVPGSTRGMNRGAIVITGNAGAQLGERMRRGLILVGNDCGAALGDRMIAGTIAVFGHCGPRAGLGMRRGTLLLAHTPSELPATFNYCGDFELGIVPLLTTHIRSISKPLAAHMSAFATCARWCGDMAYAGKGEMLIARAS